MEGRRAEATKEKQLAEEKFRAGDIAGAKESASKAESLDPSLVGLACLKASIDVNLSAEKKINGEVDWYAVLGVDPTADDETIRNGYRRLALALLSDQHRAPGSDEAYKLLSEAWKVLCNQSRKQAYDTRCRIQPRHGPRKPTVFHDFMSVPKNNQADSSSSSSSSIPATGEDTFWTMCKSCSIMYEFYREYLNKSIFCPDCGEPFEATQAPPPATGPFFSTWDSVKQQSRRANTATMPAKPDAYGGQSSSFSTVHLVGGESQSARQFSGAQGVSDVQTPGGGDENALSQPSLSARVPFSQQRFHGGGGSQPIQVSSRALSLKPQPPVAVNLTQFPKMLRNSLIGKAKRMIEQIFEQHQFVPEAQNLSEKKAKKIAEGESSNTRVGESSLPDPSTEVDEAEEDLSALTMTVPDPDFYNFDEDRTEVSFKENEVWASFDDSDGMPRFYAMIHSVVSRKPFKLSISWLNSRSNEDLGPMNWIGSGFYKTSGTFYVGRRRKLNESLNSFSHKVEWTKGAKSAVRIYPRKGQVWALYRNWSPDWDCSTPEEVVRKYDMVQVLEELDEELGIIRVVPLVKVSGFRTIFRRHPEGMSAMTFPKKELFRFSHQVASHLITGEESVNAPKGLLELDPAAMPLEFLRAFTEEETTEMEDSFMKAKEETEGKSKEDHEMGSEHEALENAAEGETSEKKEEGTQKEKGILVYKRRPKKIKTN
ncbi:PREDICTED: uncharacterized protein LOC104811585 [Tarenaya hassleriana]|uniref:uncharacterized protein LOC104811585 n=1 Tax=Tarenaya hassleriana TaxID=28532 RepID=UPI00053C33A2|nr:PREDICTED: uncharacterized protein LOC104811585 [Tarenaya hassleriana]